MEKPVSQAEFPVSQKIYAQLLRAYPPAHREKYGAAMAQLFRDQCRDAWRESHDFGLVKLWLRILPDWFCTMTKERLTTLNERKTMNDNIENLTRKRATPSALFYRVAITVFLLTLIYAAVTAFILPETFASTCKIKVESDMDGYLAPTEAEVKKQSANDHYVITNHYYISTSWEAICSPMVLSNVIAALNLNEQWGKKYFNGETLKTSEMMQILKGRIGLRPIKNTKLIEITAYSDDKNEAAAIANAMAKSYQDYRVKLADKYELPSETSHLQAVQITDPAEPSQVPIKPNKALNIVAGAVFGIFFGVVIGGIVAWMAAKRQRRFDNHLPPR